MITSLRGDEIDIAIGLTEGWVAGLVGKEQMAKNDGAGAGGYKMIGQWVETPLRWAIVTGSDRDEIQGVEDLKGGRVGVSRLGRYASFVQLPDLPSSKSNSYGDLYFSTC